MGKIPGLRINQISREIYLENKHNEKNDRISKNIETINRKELQNLIKQRVSEGIKKEEIIKELNSIDKFSKYKIYFEGYINNYIDKEENER